MRYSLVLFLVAAPAFGLDSPKEPELSPEAAKLRALATKQYRAKKYKDACESFAHAFTLAQQSGELAADLGLCLQKLGRKEEATTANQAASRLAKTWAVRKGAYFNLGALNAGLPLPPLGKCVDLPAPKSCDRVVRACAHAWKCAGNRLSSTGTALAAAMKGWADFDEKQALAEKDCAEGASPVGPNEPEWAEMEKQLAEDALQPVDSADVLLTEDLDEGATPPETQCQVVMADACAGRVGVVCRVAEPASKPRTVVEEFLLAKPESDGP